MNRPAPNKVTTDLYRYQRNIVIPEYDGMEISPTGDFEGIYVAPKALRDRHDSRRGEPLIISALITNRGEEEKAYVLFGNDWNHDDIEVDMSFNDQLKELLKVSPIDITRVNVESTSYRQIENSFFFHQTALDGMVRSSLVQPFVYMQKETTTPKVVMSIKHVIDSRTRVEGVIAPFSQMLIEFYVNSGRFNSINE